jgi:hypothetical protein
MQLTKQTIILKNLRAIFGFQFKGESSLCIEFLLQNDYQNLGPKNVTVCSIFTLGKQSKFQY